MSLSSEDPLSGMQQRLNTEIRQVFQRMPAVLDANLEGDDGVVDIPPEQMAEALQGALMLMLRHLPTIAGAIDVTRGEVARLTERVAELERRLPGEPGR